MAGLSKKTPAAVLRQEVEARTGTCQNMKQLGYRAVKFALSGEPTCFRPIGASQNVAHYVIRRTIGEKWRVVRLTGFMVKLARGAFASEDHNFQSPVFPGPIAAAIWLQVEISNGYGNSV